MDLGWPSTYCGGVLFEFLVQGIKEIGPHFPDGIDNHIKGFAAVILVELILGKLFGIKTSYNMNMIFLLLAKLFCH